MVVPTHDLYVFLVFIFFFFFLNKFSGEGEGSILINILEQFKIILNTMTIVASHFSFPNVADALRVLPYVQVCTCGSAGEQRGRVSRLVQISPIKRRAR